MATDAPPDDVSPGFPAAPVLEGGSTVRRPGHLEDVVGTLDSPDPQAGSEAVALQVRDEVADRTPEAFPVVSPQRLPVTVESGRALPGRHSVE